MKTAAAEISSSSRHDGSYTGGKGGAGVYHRLIRLMPPHRTYIALFLGHDAVMRYKRPARQNIGLDLDPQVVAWWERRQQRTPIPNLMLLTGDALDYIANIAAFFGRETLIYIDPPYLRKKCTRSYYRRKFETDQSHRHLLRKLVHLPCMMMVSGYPSELYADILEREHGWNVEHYTGQTRGGGKPECVWFNYPRPTVLHDLRFAGLDFRQRERLKRKGQRYRRKFEAMTATERQIIAEQLADLMPPNPLIEIEASANSPAQTPPPPAATPAGSAIARAGEQIRGKAAAATEHEETPPPLFRGAGDGTPL